MRKAIGLTLARKTWSDDGHLSSTTFLTERSRWSRARSEASISEAVPRSKQTGHRRRGGSPRPAAAPAQPKPWAEFPQTADGAFAYFCKKLGEPYSSAKHDDKWFAIYDKASNGKDPDEFDAADVQRLFQAVEDAF